MFCPQPFYVIEIFEHGYVYTCCPDYINNYSLGNIYELPFEKIWNGPKAINFRRMLLNSVGGGKREPLFVVITAEEKIK